MDVAVYSGTFHPMHTGHLAILNFLVREGFFGEIRLIVSPRNPFKDSSYAMSAEDRFMAAKEAVARHPELLGKVIVDDMEMKMPPPSYSIRTLDALKSSRPGDSFTLIIGGDNLAGILNWKEGSRLLADYGVAVYPRRSFDSEALRKALLNINPAFRIRLLDAPTVDISATEIREGIACGKNMSGFLM